jgi:porin
MSLAGTGSTSADAGEPNFFTGILRRDNLLGDMGGLRSLLGRYGITLTLTDVSDVLGNTSGGIDRGSTYSALTTLTVQMDTQKAFGWDGGLINVSGLQIRGRNFSQFYLDNLQTASGIEAANTTRLWEVWYQQTFGDGTYDVKLGQQSLDQEFMASQGSALYLNTMMGWPMLPSADLYAGGPAYPLSSLGIRLRARPTGSLTLLAGVFQDNPPGGPFDDDGQLRGSTRWGGNFNLRTGALFIAEAQYTINQPANGDMDKGNGSTGLPGTYKIGAWFDTAAFPDQRFDTAGVPLASPDSNGMPRMDQHNFSLYGVADQMIWRPGPESPRSLNAFVRIMGAPSNRNLISFSVNAGLNLKAPLPTRDDDTFGVGFGIAKVSSGASGFDADTNTFASSPFLVPVRGTETFLEITYQIQVTPWLQIQPDFQYIFTPGGGIPNPNNPTQSVRNEAVFGFRTGITF